MTARRELVRSTQARSGTGKPAASPQTRENRQAERTGRGPLRADAASAFSRSSRPAILNRKPLLACDGGQAHGAARKVQRSDRAPRIDRFQVPVLDAGRFCKRWRIACHSLRPENSATIVTEATSPLIYPPLAAGSAPAPAGAWAKVSRVSFQRSWTVLKARRAAA